MLYAYSLCFCFNSSHPKGWGTVDLGYLFSSDNFFNSINHEYKEWNDKNPQVTTCNQNTRNLILGGVIPQEVDTDKEIVFSYDVSFKVSSY